MDRQSAPVLAGYVDKATHVHSMVSVVLAHRAIRQVKNACHVYHKMIIHTIVELQLAPGRVKVIRNSCISILDKGNRKKNLYLD